jgi:hypothetical protein
MLSRIRIDFWAALVLLILPGLALAQTRPASLPPLDSLRISEMVSIVRELSQTAAAAEQTLGRQLESNSSILADWEAQLAVVKLDTTAAKATLDSLSKATKAAKKQVRIATNQHKNAQKTISLLNSMAEMDSLNLRKNLPKAWKQTTRIYENASPPSSAPTTEAEPVSEAASMEAPAPSPPQISPANPSKSFATYNPANDVMLRPPSAPCVIASSSRDEFSGEISREMAGAELFRYTNPALKNYLKGKTHVVCEAALSSSGTRTNLLLTFNINDPNARKAFGRLEKNGIATLKFLDGTTFQLQNAIADEGVFNLETESAVFRAQYPLNPEVLKKIRRSELDKIRILWSKGYDDYDVQQVDLLMQQAACLFK